jgi:hypothetical protein
MTPTILTICEFLGTCVLRTTTIVAFLFPLFLALLILPSKPQSRFSLWQNRVQDKLSSFPNLPGLGSLVLFAVTVINLSAWFRNYGCFIERTTTQVAILVGLILAVISTLMAIKQAHTRHSWQKFIGIAGIIAWLGVSGFYLANCQTFEELPGKGPMPKHLWMNPPVAAMKCGDLLLSSHESDWKYHQVLGHAEIVIRDKDGTLKIFTCRMEKGVIIREPSEYVDECKRNGWDYWVCRPKKALTEKAMSAGTTRAYHMLDENIAWRESANIEAAKLHQKPETGFDWHGMLNGIHSPHRWTCISACHDILVAMQVPVQDYGKGILGFGGFLNPKEPARYLGDPALHVLDVNDQHIFTAK